MPTLDQMLPSRFLKQADVPSPVVVTVADVTKEVIEKNTGETKWCLRFREFERPLACNSTNLKRIAHIAGSKNTDHWIGKRAVLYVDPNVEFAGDIVGGLRLRSPKLPIQRNSTYTRTRTCLL